MKEIYSAYYKSRLICKSNQKWLIESYMYNRGLDKGNYLVEKSKLYKNEYDTEEDYYISYKDDENYCLYTNIDCQIIGKAFERYMESVYYAAHNTDMIIDFLKMNIDYNREKLQKLLDTSNFFLQMLDRKQLKKDKRIFYANHELSNVNIEDYLIILDSYLTERELDRIYRSKIEEE